MQLSFSVENIGVESRKITNLRFVLFFRGPSNFYENECFLKFGADDLLTASIVQAFINKMRKSAQFCLYGTK